MCYYSYVYKWCRGGKRPFNSSLSHDHPHEPLFDLTLGQQQPYNDDNDNDHQFEDLADQSPKISWTNPSAVAEEASSAKSRHKRNKTGSKQDDVRYIEGKRVVSPADPVWDFNKDMQLRNIVSHWGTQSWVKVRK